MCGAMWVWLCFERDGCGHFGGESGSEGTELFVNVNQKGVGFPSAHLFDGGRANPAEM